MPAQDKGFFGLYNRSLGSLTTTGANETIKLPAAGALGAALTGSQILLSSVYVPSEVWRPLFCSWQVTTGVTVTAAVLTLRRNGVSAVTGGTVTIPIQAIDATQEFFSTISAYTFAGADGPNDKWSMLVTTTSTAGVISLTMYYGTKYVAGLNEGVQSF
jgi:hypothetical protein